MRKLTYTSLVFICAGSINMRANEFRYFDAGIDYWGEHKHTAESAPETEDQPDENADKSSFNWKPYMDPQTNEFFKEGEYTPPEPFMELVRNPTDESIQNWFKLIELKNKLSQRMRDRIDEYQIKHGQKLPDESKESLTQTKNSLPIAQADTKRYRFRMYFDSKCPHCRNMFNTIQDLQSRGFYVEARQVDNDLRAVEHLPLPIQKASRQELAEKDIKSVPVLLIGDMKNNSVYRLNGYQTSESIFQSIQQQETSKKGL